MCISLDWSSSSHRRYLWLVYWHVVQFFTTCVIWKLHRGTCNNWELILYKFELMHNTVEASESICWLKSEGAVIHSWITRWWKKLCLGCKKLDDQARSGEHKLIDSKAKLQATEARMVSNTWRVSGKLGISHLHNLSKSIHIHQIIPHVTKCRTFDSPSYKRFWVIWLIQVEHKFF